MLPVNIISNNPALSTYRKERAMGQAFILVHCFGIVRNDIFLMFGHSENSDLHRSYTIESFITKLTMYAIAMQIQTSKIPDREYTLVIYSLIQSSYWLVFGNEI